MGVVASVASRYVYLVRMPPKLREVGGNNAAPDADPQLPLNKWILRAPSENPFEQKKSTGDSADVRCLRCLPQANKSSEA